MSTFWRHDDLAPWLRSWLWDTLGSQWAWFIRRETLIEEGSSASISQIIFNGRERAIECAIDKWVWWWFQNAIITNRYRQSAKFSRAWCSSLAKRVSFVVVAHFFSKGKNSFLCQNDLAWERKHSFIWLPGPAIGDSFLSSSISTRSLVVVLCYYSTYLGQLASPRSSCFEMFA